MKFLLKAVLTLSVFFSLGAYAAHEPGPFSVSSLRVSNDGIYVTFSPAPQACGGNTYYRTHARVSTSDANYDSLYSVLLAAYSSGATFRYLFFATPSGTDGCSSAGGLLNLQMLELAHK